MSNNFVITLNGGIFPVYKNHKSIKIVYKKWNFEIINYTVKWYEVAWANRKNLKT